MNEKNLVIVESPAKAKTIEKYLGKDFKVVSSMGHVRDLPKDNKAIDIKHGFKPKYEVTEDKKEIVKRLKELAKKAEQTVSSTSFDLLESETHVKVMGTNQLELYSKSLDNAMRSTQAFLLITTGFFIYTMF